MLPIETVNFHYVTLFFKPKGAFTSQYLFPLATIESHRPVLTTICIGYPHSETDALKQILVNYHCGAKNSDYGPLILADIETNRQTLVQHAFDEFVRLGRKHDLQISALESAVCKIELYKNLL